MAKTAHSSKKFAAYPRLNPLGVGKNISAADLIDQAFLAYNGGRLREAAKLLTEKMLPNDGFIGMSLTGRADAGGSGQILPDSADESGVCGLDRFHRRESLSRSALRAEHGALRRVRRFWMTWTLHQDGVIRIYDILFDYNVLLDTDAFVREVIQGPEFQRHDGHG